MKFTAKILSLVIAFATILNLLISCDKAPQMPKPSTYLRLKLDKPQYTIFQNADYPFTFMRPIYAEYEPLNSGSKEVKWFNLNFKNYHFVANVSVIPIHNISDLNASVNDQHTFLHRHEKLSGGIVSTEYANKEKKVYATTFDIKGKDVVSPYQFYITDSSKYFVRVALNCTFIPNNDSCEVVVNQLKEDLNYMIQTFEWK